MGIILIGLIIVILIFIGFWNSSKPAKKRTKYSESTSTSSEPSDSKKYIYRNGNMVKADEVFDSWTSGDLDKMLNVVNKPTNILDHHHLLMGIVNQTYKNRSDPKMAKICMETAEKHISEFPKILKALKEDMPDFLPRVSTFQQYATLLVELGNFQRAIEVCNKAIEYGLRDNTKTGFEGRIERIKRKMGKK